MAYRRNIAGIGFSLVVLCLIGLSGCRINDHKPSEQNRDSDSYFSNNFCPSPTYLSFELPNPGHFAVTIYNVQGKLVRKIEGEAKAKGLVGVDWEGRDDSSTLVETGIYFYKVDAVDFSLTRKLVHQKGYQSGSSTPGRGQRTLHASTTLSMTKGSSPASFPL